MYTGFRSSGPLKGSSIDYFQATDKYLSDKERIAEEQENKRLLREFEKARLEFEKQKALEAQSEKALDRGLREKELKFKETELDKKYGKSARPFEGTGFDSQLVNTVYDFNLKKGLDPDTALKRAIDEVQKTKQTATRVIDEFGNPYYSYGPRYPLISQPQAPRDFGRAPAPVIVEPNETEKQPSRTWLGEIPKATGFANVVGGEARSLLSNFTPIKPNEEYERAKAFIGTVDLMANRVLARNPRFSDSERQDIQKRIDSLKPGMFKTPEEAIAGAQGLDDYFLIARKDALEVIKNPSSYAKDVVTEARRLIKEIDEVRAAIAAAGSGQAFGSAVENTTRNLELEKRLKKYE